MIKKYNQFVSSRVNENFSDEDIHTDLNPITEEPEMEEAPEMDEVEEAPELPEEEGGEYMGQKMMVDLASELGVEIGTDGSINHNGKKINFYSETEMFHVDKKKFKTADEVINYLGSAPDNKSIEENDDMLARQEHSPSKEDMDELMAAHDEEDFIDEEEEEFESKSYKRTFESYKRKK